MEPLRITSFLGENTYPVIEQIASYLSGQLNKEVRVVEDVPEENKLQHLEDCHIHLGWMCGLLYTRLADHKPDAVKLLAAPVLTGERYQHQPVYFSDVIVREDSPFASIADLNGSTWAFNERQSFSGYLLFQHRLLSVWDNADFFEKLIESGSHRRSLQMVINGQADVSAIDSTLLDYELAKNPLLADRFRVIEILGPNPVPPWVASGNLPTNLRQEIRHALLGMAIDPNGMALLAECSLARFAKVSDDDYESIRFVDRTVREHMERQMR